MCFFLKWEHYPYKIHPLHDVNKIGGHIVIFLSRNPNFIFFIFYSICVTIYTIVDLCHVFNDFNCLSICRCRWSLLLFGLLVSLFVSCLLRNRREHLPCEGFSQFKWLFIFSHSHPVLRMPINYHFLTLHLCLSYESFRHAHEAS